MISKSTLALLPFPSSLIPRASKTIPYLRRRTTLLAFLALLSLCAYTVFIAPPSLQLSPVAAARRNGRFRNPVMYAAVQRNQPGTTASRHIRPWTLSLSPKQELAALCSFLGALASNALPLSVEPSEPLDPQLVLEFDFTKRTQEDVRDEIEYIVSDVWERYPVVMFSKSHNPTSRAVKALLKELDIRPMPKVFEDVNARSDAPVLVPLLHRLTFSTDLPLLLIGGEPVGSLDLSDSEDDESNTVKRSVTGNLDVERLRELQKSGELRNLIENAGARVTKLSTQGKKKWKNA